MHQLFFAIALHLEVVVAHHRQSDRDGQHRNEEQKREQNVAPLTFWAARKIALMQQFHNRSPTYPGAFWVSGMFCRLL